MILRRLRRRPSTWFLAAGALGLVAALMTFRVAARTPTAPVVVAGDVIPAGTPVAAAPVVIRSVPSGVAALPGVTGFLLVTGMVWRAFQRQGTASPTAETGAVS